MKFLSRIELDSFPYFLVLDDREKAMDLHLFSIIHPKNYMKGENERYKDQLTEQMLETRFIACAPYMVESLRHSKVTGKNKIYKSSFRLDKILNALITARDYAYPKDAITVPLSVTYSPCHKAEFTASDSVYAISYTKENNVYKTLSFRCEDLNISFEPRPNIRSPRAIVYEQVKTQHSVLNLATVNQLTLDSLAEVVDLSWYWNPETREVKKDYKSIMTIEDLEKKVISPMVYTILDEHEKGIKSVIAMDTETTGLNVLYLSDTNPEKDRISTMQFSWKDDQSVLIYFDMDNFKNVDKKYFFDRVRPLFKYPRRKRLNKQDVTFGFDLYYDRDGNKLDKPLTVILSRAWFDLTGHNVSFDSRVTLSEGCQFYFDHDTLQMAFNLDPTVKKKNKGLKRLTRYFFNHETLELSDVLGKGHEGDFHTLNNSQIAEIYGCADTDYSRKLFFALRELIISTDIALGGPSMWKSYCSLDPITWFLSAQSEYYGLRLDSELVHKNAETIRTDLGRLEDLIYRYVGNVLHYRARMLLHGYSEEDLTSSQNESTKMALEGKVSSINLESGERFEFNLKGNELRSVIYDRLKYPVKVYTKKGEPAVDKEAIKKLLYYQTESSSGILKEDFLSIDGKNVLIEADKFNHYKYPLCYLLSEYKKLDKEYTGYYLPFEKQDTENRLFKSISTTNIETRRISCAAQTIKKSLKKGILPHDPINFYSGDFDFDQIEARVFTGHAGDVLGVLKLDSIDTDYHTENAAAMYAKPAYLVTPDERKDAKSVGFGIPYGLGDRSLCERLFTVYSKMNELKTRQKRQLFEKSHQMEMDYLNGIRANAINPVDVPIALKRFWGVADDTTIGMVRNKDGFWRYFVLDGVLGDRGKEASVKRQAGNYPIQSYAADLLRLALKRFYNRVVDEGYEDKIIFNMYIHDELLFSVHKSIDPRKIAQMVAESCMFKIANEATYFVGLAFGKSWYECKTGVSEMPAGLLCEIAENFDSYKLNDWTENAFDDAVPIIKDYQKRRVNQSLHEYVPSMDTNPINVQTLISKFENYKVRSYLYDLYSKKLVFKPKERFNNIKQKMEVVDDDKFLACLCTHLMEEGHGDLELVIDNNDMSVLDYVSLRNSDVLRDNIDGGRFTIVDDYDNETEEDNGSFDSYWSFDEDEDNDEDKAFEYHVLGMYDDVSDEDDETPELPKYENLRIYGSILEVTVPRTAYLSSIISKIQSDKYASGYRVILKTPICDKELSGLFDVDLAELDSFISTLATSELVFNK